MTEDLETRLDLFISSWPKTLQDSFYRYSRSFRKRPNPAESRYSSRQRIPCWHFLPGWILRSQKKNSLSENHTKLFLKDVLWGQYCLFFSIRVKDDLFDQQADDPLLLFAGEQFALEADQVYSEYFPKADPFWGFYRKFLRETIEGIVEVNAMQRKRRSARNQLLEAYARVSAIFKVGSVAVCLKFRRTGLLLSVQRTLDELAVAGQILDDFMDIVEDCQQNRINFAASVFLDPRNSGRPTNYLEEIARGFLQTDAEEKVFAAIGLHLDKALVEAKPLHSLPLERLILRYQKSIQLIEEYVYRGRVKRIFALPLH